MASPPLLRGARAHARGAATPLLVGLGLLVFGWASIAITPVGGLDPSWGAALHMAARSELNWGPDLVFTYGPLGFLRVPTYWYEGTGAFAVLYVAVTHLALLALLWALARRSFGALGAAAILLLVAPLIQEAVPPLFFAWAIWLFSSERSPRAWLTFAAVTGAVGALEVLMKINTGALVLAIGAVAVLFAPAVRPRLVAVLAGSAAVAGLLGWVLSGQPLGALPEWVANAGRVVSGYSAVMSIEEPDLRWNYSLALVLFLLGLYACWVTTSWRTARARWGAVATWTALSFISFKSGFVRHDLGHALLFFGVMLAAFPAFAWHRRAPAVGVAAIALALVGVLASANLRVTDVLSPVDRADAAWSDLSSMVRPGEQERHRREGLERVRAEEDLDLLTEGLLRGRTVHVSPVETAVVWAYELDWEPLPVFQDYQAYTARLDRNNADKLESSSAPERVLLGSGGTIDSRLQAFDTPQATRTLLCRYRPVRAQDDRWFVLARRERSRCGEPRLISSVRAAWGQDVAVPAPLTPGAGVMLSVAGTAVTGTERLRNALYKAHERYLALNGGTTRYRLVPGSAGNGMLLSAPQGLEYPAPFTLGSAPNTVAVDRESRPRGGTPIRLDFYEIPLVD